ncbi:MAG: nitrogen regulation protein NR(II) [Candidatus Krumholzibacteriia bacterium]
MSLRLVVLWSTAGVACALSLSALVPMQFAILGTGVLLLVGVLVLQRQGARGYAAIAARIEAVKGVRTGGERLGLWADPGRQLASLAHNLVRDLEDSYFRLIKTNIQLLSLKEVGRSFIASLDQKRTVDSVLEYLNRGVGFSEYGLFTWRPEEGVFEGGVRRRRGDRFEWVANRFALPEASGMLAKSLGMQRSYLIKDAQTHALGSLHGEPLFPESVHESFVIVPLVKTSPPGPVWERRGCAPASCPACSESEVRDWTAKYANEPDPDFWEGGRFRCWSCPGFPVLGCILATDAGRDVPLSKIDLIMLETLAQNLSTVLENARLYEELKREERFRENVIGGMSNGLLSVDLEGGITLFNLAAERLSGDDAAQRHGRPSSELFLDPHGRDPLRDALEAGRGARGVEATLRTASAKTLPIQLATSLLRDEKGQVYGVIGEFADLSAIKGMEAQIRHLDKLAALGRFTSSIAHEIRNPLAGITAGIQYLTKRMEGDEATHVEFILAEVDRLNRIINDLFSAGRPLELSLQDTDLVHLVDRSVRTLQTRFEARGVECVRRVQPDLPRVGVDADRIEQVLINLIQNAIEASPRGESIEIEQRLGSSSEPLVESAEVDSLITSVRDHGEGIPQEDRDKIFEPFYTTKARGTGLGLYVCHHIVEGHGGQIVVDSRPGEGSCFLLCLPLGRILMGGPSETADLARR